MKCRGQITLFMIVGLVVVFSFGFVLYISLQLNHAKEVVQANAEVPAPVIFYLESLLEDAVRGAVIETIGPQGGYQDPSSAVNREPTVFAGKRIEMNFKDEPVRFQRVDEFPSPTYPYTVPEEAGPHPVPYYYLLGKLSIPSHGRMNSELQSEVIKRFNASLDLGTFDGAGFTIEEPERGWSINVSINREDISAVLSWPLEIRTGDQRSVLGNLSVVLPLRLNDSYALAECLVDRVVFEVEHSLPGDPTEPDVIERCKSALGLDDDFTVRTRELPLDGDDKGRRFVSVVDEKNERDTGVPFEFQYMIWKCSGEFDYGDDEQKMRVCESACAYEIPEVVLLGLCTRESGCDHFDPLPTVKKSPDGGIGIMQLTGTTCKPSIVDGKPLDKDDQDLEDNVECGAQELKGYYNDGVHGRYCCPFRFETAGKNVYNLYCVDQNHQCNNPNYLNDVCCRSPGASEPFRYLASEDYPPYNPCEWEHHRQAIPGTDPVQYLEWDDVTNIPPYCCEPGHPTYGQYCCEKVTAAPGWPSGQNVVDENAYFIYADEDVPGTSFSGVIKDADYSRASWDGALRRYNGWGCESGFFNDEEVNCVIENYVDAAHKFGYDEKNTCRSTRSTPAIVGGSDYVGQSDYPEGCCPRGDSVTPCRQSRALKGWPSWP